MSKTPHFHYGYVIVACCCLIMGVCIGLVLSCAGIFYQPVSSELGIPVGRFGLYMSFNYVASTLMLPFAGKLIQRHSARWLLTASAALLGLTVVAMSMFNAVWQFYLAGALIGISMAFLLYLSFPTLINRWFKTQMGLFIGICSAASGIGGVLFNPIGATLIENFGWRTTYMFFGLAMLLVVAPVLALFLRDYPSDKGLQPYGEKDTVINNTPKEVSGIAYSDALRMPAFYALLVFAFLIMAVSTLNLFIPKYALGIDYTLQQAALAASAVMVGVTVGKIVLGYVNDHSPLAGLLLTTLCGTAGLLLLLFGQMGLWAILLGAFLFGWEYAGVTVQTPMLVRKVFGSHDYAEIYANISIAIAVGGAVSSGGWGLLADATSYTTILIVGVGGMAALALLGLFALGGKR